MKAVFSVKVLIRDTHTIKNEDGEINMIVFEGSINEPFFKGVILSGACDTQKYLKGKQGMLSARYMLKGTDDEGNATKIFIENNALLSDDGKWKTTPTILCDNPRLRWLSELSLSGEIEGWEKGVYIHFYEEVER